jgi:hypothetical protein
MLQKDLEKLLSTRQYYQLRITDLNGGVVHNNKTRKSLKYFTMQLEQVENQIKELLDNYDS